MNFFQRQLKGKIKYKLCKNLKKAIKDIFQDIKKIEKDKKITILLSQLVHLTININFENRGNNLRD